MKSVIVKATTDRFTWEKTGWWLVGLNLAMAVNSTIFFTTQLKSGLDGWLAMNSCAPSIFIFCLGYLIKNRSVMAVGAGLMFRYGTLGLFIFGWTGMSIIPQVGHILMTLAVIYFFVKMVRSKEWDAIVVCAFVAGLMLYAEWQWNWLGDRPQVLDGLFRGELTPEMFQ